MKKLATVILLSVFFTGTVMADEFGDSFYGYPAWEDNAGKFYAGVDLAYVSYGGSFYPSTNGLRISGGYNFTSTLAVEAGYTMLSNSSNNCGYGCGYGAYGGYGYGGYGYAPPPMASYAFDVTSIQIAAVGTIPITDAFSISAKAGLDRNSMTYSSTDNLGNSLPDINGSQSNRMFGVGAQYNVGNGLVVRAQYENLGNLVPGVGMRMISLGGLYNF